MWYIDDHVTPVEYPSPVLLQLSPFSLYRIDKWIKPQNFVQRAGRMQQEAGKMERPIHCSRTIGLLVIIRSFHFHGKTSRYCSVF
jgi:hypothetical protein